MLCGVLIDGGEHIRIDPVSGDGLKGQFSNELQGVTRRGDSHLCARLDERTDEFGYLIRRNPSADTDYYVLALQQLF